MKHIYKPDKNMKKGGPRTYVSDTCGTLYKSPQKPREPHILPRKIDRKKITTRRRKTEIKNRKNNHTSKREEKKGQVRQKEAI